jgi:hypothetical protein
MVSSTVVPARRWRIGPISAILEASSTTEEEPYVTFEHFGVCTQTQVCSQNDTALDVREAWVEPVRRGRAPTDVSAEVVGAFGSDDPVVWLALAETQWRWGMLEASIRERTIGLIDSGQALGEWAGTE